MIAGTVSLVSIAGKEADAEYAQTPQLQVVIQQNIQYNDPVSYHSEEQDKPVQTIREPAEPEAVSEEKSGYTFTEEEQEALLRIAMSEAGGEDLTGKILVMEVVINRMESEEFPDDVISVIMQEGQFSPISDGRYYDVIPDSECKDALNIVISGSMDLSEGALYFENAGASAWHKTHLQKLFEHGNHTFYTDKDGGKNIEENI